jgi:adenylosuccinate lyase
MSNPNVLSLRYATPEMNALFSREGIVLAQRDLWIAVMKAQQELGVDIPGEVIARYEAARNEIDFAKIDEIEARTRHDVKARIEAFNVGASAEHIHKGLTSRDLTDNVQQMLFRDATQLVMGKYVSVLRHMLEKAEEYRGIVLAARTHHQPAQPTLLGRRMAMWAEELHEQLEGVETFLARYPLRGIKGPVGTQADMLTLLGSQEKVEALERMVAQELGFERTLHATGQVYPRSLDYGLLTQLALLAAPVENFAKGMRLMSGYELVTEGFKEGQVGSSAMPHKMNTRSSERICGFSLLLKMYASGGSMLAGDTWEEGDVSCSVVRRVIMPDSFYASDGLCETALTVTNEMGAYPAIIQAEVDRYLPFLATTQILMEAVQAGVGREAAHDLIKKHAVAEALAMRTEGRQPNLAYLLGQEPVFADTGITEERINGILDDKARFIGTAGQQIDAVRQRAQPLLTKYAVQAAYEPGQIL